MTGQNLIDYIQEGKLEDAEIFVAADGKLACTNINNIMELTGDLILGNVVLDEENMKRYFSRWFEVVGFETAKLFLWMNRNMTEREMFKPRSIYVLLSDGTDYCADDYTEEELKQEYKNDCLFGLEKE